GRRCGDVLSGYVFVCPLFARGGSALLSRVRRSCKAVSSEVCGGSAPTPPGLFGRRKRSPPPNRPGVVRRGGAPLRAEPLRLTGLTPAGERGGAPPRGARA